MVCRGNARFVDEDFPCDCRIAEFGSPLFHCSCSLPEDAKGARSSVYLDLNDGLVNRDGVLTCYDHRGSVEEGTDWTTAIAIHGPADGGRTRVSSSGWTTSKVETGVSSPTCSPKLQTPGDT